MSRRITRRRFMHGVATTTGAVFAGPYILKAAEVGKDRLRIAYVATGGQAGSHLPLVEKSDDKNSIVKNHVCPAFAEVDKTRWKRIKELQPDAVGYTDYRQMFDKHLKEIDAVVVTTPDHNHAAASMIAIKNGKHCYTEKPLTWSIDEAKKLAAATADKKVATQMGNMGHANEGNRRIVEIVQSGVLGDISEVHSWTNRPVWPQGIEKRPPAKPAPEGMDWNSWIGPAPYREYHDGLAHFAWRGWFDFGCGAMGDMGCHTWDNVFWSMQPDYPNVAVLEKIVGRTQETYPKQSATRWEFPAKGNRPAFKAWWYEGGLKPAVPEEIMNDPKRENKKLPDSGNLYIGSKGKLLIAGDYGDSPRLIPEEFHGEQAGNIPKTLPRSPGHKQEWILACTGQKPWDSPGSNFSKYAAPLTEVMLVGAIAIRLGEEGGRVECDPTARIVKTKEALQYVSRQYRQGWTL